VLVAPRAILLPLDALGVQALVLVGEIVAVLTVVAGENDFLSGHYLRVLRVLGVVRCSGSTSST
jgi:hypothetical protein